MYSSGTRFAAVFFALCSSYVWNDLVSMLSVAQLVLQEADTENSLLRETLEMRESRIAELENEIDTLNKVSPNGF